FFYLGFVTAAFTNYNLVALGVIGAVMAILYIKLSPKYNRVAGEPAQAAGNNDIDNELDSQVSEMVDMTKNTTEKKL
ncbi:hypothetical protein Q6265_31335, partial [Klebsiella pneumoniae]|nr:hypothetical protein [Klebsiella pneumoniae]